MLCPFTLLVTGGRAATLEFHGQGVTSVGPDTLTHTLYHKGITSTGGIHIGAIEQDHSAASMWQAYMRLAVCCAQRV